MEINIVILTLFMCQICEGLRFQVTKAECGRAIDLSKENRVIIDYASSDFINMTGFCVIDLTTSNPNEMICISSINRTYLIDILCSWSLSYHIGGYGSYGEEYECNDFNRKSLCKNTRRVSLAYSDNILFKDVSVSVKLYSKTYIPTTTRRPWSSWSFWSHQTTWTSSYDNDNDKKSNKGSSGTIIAVISGTIVVIVIFIVCVAAKCGKGSTPVNQNDTNPQDRYSSEKEHIDDGLHQHTYHPGANFNQTHLSGSQPVQPLSQGPPSYEEYQKHKLIYQPDTNDVQPLPPDTENQPIPSAPPPPYPGN